MMMVPKVILKEWTKNDEILRRQTDFIAVLIFQIDEWMNTYLPEDISDTAIKKENVYVQKHELLL